MKETFERCGCTWEVVRRYQLTDEYMKAHQLFFRNRIELRCIKSNGVIPLGFVMNCAESKEGKPL